MQNRALLVLILAATPLLIHKTVYGQSPSLEYGLYCSAGLHADGYVDFSGLPPATNITNQQGLVTPSAPVSTTLPVQGVPGLTVTVTIPALSNPASGSSPAFWVNGGTLQLNGLPGTPLILGLVFNQPVAGVSLNATTMGRFEYRYTLQVGTQVGTQGVDPPAFATTATGYTLDLNSPQTQHLEMVGLLSSRFQTASVEFSGDEYSSIQLSNIRVQSGSAPDPAMAVPTNGLQQWLRADQAALTLNGAGSLWRDQSGHGHDATPSSNPPTLTADGRNCQPAWLFTGKQAFHFSLPIAGWSEMTLFLVGKTENAQPPSASFAGNSAVYWAADEPSGTTFVSPYQSNVYARFGTTQPGNTLYYSRPGGSIGQDFTTTRAVHDHGADSLYVNGIAVERRERKLSVLGGETGEGVIGGGIQGTFFRGEISEILVYDRVLSTQEAALVETYLARKYGAQ